jgi:amino-acid N-acetyltransferase
MSNASLTLRECDEDGIQDVERLLADNDLPASDVRSGPATFYRGFVDGDTVGAGGLEVYGAAGLLRSVVIEESARGNGLGTVLCDAVEAEARDRGVERLYLLTTTAEEFFAKRGYEVVDRADAPAAIRETSEFRELCPDAATPMRTSL